MVTDSLEQTHAGIAVNRWQLGAAVAVCVALSGAAGWALAERTSQPDDAPVSGTITVLSGDASKVCIEVASRSECGVLVVPPGTTTPSTGQTVKVFIRQADGTEFLILPSTFG